MALHSHVCAPASAAAKPAAHHCMRGRPRGTWLLIHSLQSSSRRKRKREGSRTQQPQRSVMAPQADGVRVTGPATFLQHAAALGLDTSPNACALWGRRGCDTLAAVDKALAPLARALADAMGAVSAARLAASVAADAGWCLAALAALSQVLIRDAQAVCSSSGMRCSVWDKREKQPAEPSASCGCQAAGSQTHGCGQPWRPRQGATQVWGFTVPQRLCLVPRPAKSTVMCRKPST